MTTDFLEYLHPEKESANAKKRVAVYCRVSTDKEDQANSFESQKRYFGLYVQRHPNWELVQIFADEGISGTNTKKRRAFHQMIERAKQGDFDLIVTKEISRFARNTLDSIYYTRELKKYGVGVFFMNDNINTLDTDSELRLTILSSIAQEESRKTSERVKWGQRRQMEQGVVFGRSLLGYDVHGGKLYVNEEGAKIVRLIFHKFVEEGKGTHVIARELQESGIHPMRVKKWQSSVILRILRNEKYCGDLIQKKTFTPDYLSHEKKYNRGQESLIVLRDHHEPIVPRDLFDRANRLLDIRSSSQKGQTKHSCRYGLSGKIKCGYCGSSYVARYKTRKDGSQYKAWRCLEACRHGNPHTDPEGNCIGCPGLGIRNDDIMHILCLTWQNLCFDRQKITDHLIRIVQHVLETDAAESPIAPWKQQIHLFEQKRIRLIDLYLSGRIDQDEFLSVRTKYEQEFSSLCSNIKAASKKESGTNQYELIRQIQDTLAETINGTQSQEDFYRYILEKIVVNDKHHVNVQFRFLPFSWSYCSI